MVQSDGQIVGCGNVWDSSPHVRVSSWGNVHPDYQNRGIGTALCRWIEERARQSIPQAPQGARVSLLQKLLSTNVAACELLRQQGFHVVRHTYRMLIEMDGPPAAPAIPAGLAIRPFIQGREERALVQAVQEAFRDHWGHLERPFEDVYRQWMHRMENDPDFDPSLCFVAMDDDEIAGVCLCSLKTARDPEMGYVRPLGVRRPWRRRGLGLALLLHSFGELYRRGQRKVGLGVDGQSLTGATRLYEKAGMHVHRQFFVYEKELRVGEELSTQSVEG